jgi:hypothetical protein
LLYHVISTCCGNRDGSGGWEGSYPINILRTPRLEKNKTHLRVLNQSRDEHEVAALVRWVGITRRAAVCADEEPIALSAASPSNVLKKGKIEASVVDIPSLIDIHRAEIQ